MDSTPSPHSNAKHHSTPGDMCCQKIARGNAKVKLWSGIETDVLFRHTSVSDTIIQPPPHTSSVGIVI